MKIRDSWMENGGLRGFTPEHVFEVRPDLAGVDEVVVDGETVIMPRFKPGNWYVEDNPELL